MRFGSQLWTRFTILWTRFTIFIKFWEKAPKSFKWHLFEIILCLGSCMRSAQRFGGISGCYWFKKNVKLWTGFTISDCEPNRPPPKKTYFFDSKLNSDKKLKLEEIESKNMCALSLSTVCESKFQQLFLCTIFLQTAFMFTRNFLIQLIPLQNNVKLSLL